MHAAVSCTTASAPQEDSTEPRLYSSCADPQQIATQQPGQRQLVSAGRCSQRRSLWSLICTGRMIICQTHHGHSLIEMIDRSCLCTLLPHPETHTHTRTVVTCTRVWGCCRSTRPERYRKSRKHICMCHFQGREIILPLCNHTSLIETDTPSIWTVYAHTHGCVWRRTVFLSVTWDEKLLLMLVYLSCRAVVVLTHTAKPQTLSQWFVRRALSTGNLLCFESMITDSYSTFNLLHKVVNGIKSLVKWSFLRSFGL